MEWLDRISVTCFSASYLVVLGLEITRTLFLAKWFRWIAATVSIAGLFAHLVYLANHQELVIDSNGVLFGGWNGWFFASSVLVVIAYLWLLFRQGNSVLGIYLVALALIAIAVGNWPGQNSEFSVRETRSIWNTIHGLSFLLSTTIVGMGFLFGTMYLIQARRLKKGQILKFRLPSLEWLQNSGEKALWASAALLTIGVISGVAINLVNRIQGVVLVTWQDPVVWTSATLLVWLLASLAFNWWYRRNREGRRVSYLVMSCFLFLVLEIGLVLYSGHATSVVDPQASTFIAMDEAQI